MQADARIYCMCTSGPWKNGEISHRYHDKGFVSFYAICCVSQQLMKCISELKIECTFEKNNL